MTEIQIMRNSLEQLEEEKKPRRTRKGQEDQQTLNENTQSLENGKHSEIENLLPETFPKSFLDLGDLVKDVGKEILKESLQEFWGEFSKESDSKKKKSKK